MNWIGIYVTLFCWFYLNQLATAADKLAQAITYGANKRLLKDLFLNNPQTNLIRGVEKFSENVTVRIGISLMNILDVVRNVKIIKCVSRTRIKPFCL